MDCSPPGSSVHEISQARILEWVVISSSRGSSWPRDWTWVSCLACRFFTTEPPGKPICVQKCRYFFPHISQFSKINWVSWNSTQFWDSIRSCTSRVQSHKIDPTSELGIDMYTLPSLKWITSKNLLHSTGTLFNVIWQPGREGSWERMDTCIHMAEALCCPPETHMVNPIYSNIK